MPPEPYYTPCENCGKRLFVNDILMSKSAVFRVCPRCGWEVADLFCTTCKRGGHFINNIQERPRTWQCACCGTRHILPRDFYNRPQKFVVKNQE